MRLPHARGFGIRLFLLVVGLVFGLATNVCAQSAGTGTIQGRVVDEKGGVVAGAKVTVRNAETNVSRELETDAQGEYRAVLLQPALYEVTVQISGFATVKRTGIRVEVGSTAAINVELKVAAVTEVVTVTGEAPIADPEKVEVSNVVTQKQIEELPINGRRWDNFVLLTPGVIPDGTFGLISSRGISGLLNNNTVDGADNNQAFFSEARGRTRVAYTYSQSAIKEFQVGLSTFSAEFGRAAGGTINAVTKSGTNEWHGEGFYYIRDDSLQAREPTLRDFADNPLKNKDRRQQYGLSLGFPLMKDKLFFFGSFDQQLRTESYLSSPSSGGFFRNFLNGPPGRPLDGCLRIGPTPQLRANCNALLAFFQAQAIQNPRKRINNVALGKVDWVIHPNHTFTASYNWHRWKSPSGIQTQQTLARAASDNGFDGVKTDSVVSRLNSLLSARMVNEAKFQYGRDFEFQLPNSRDPRTTITGGISFGMSEFLPRPAWPDEHRYQWTDTLSWTIGRHTLKTGLDINYVRGRTENIRFGGGEYSYTSLNGLAQDCPLGARQLGCVPIPTGPTTGKHYSGFTQAFDLRGQNGSLFFTTTDYNFFVQDTFKWTPTLTMNAGIRYEYQRLPEIKPPFTGHPQFPESQRLNTDTNNWGPRLAFAWDIGGKQKNVVRAGGGIYYGRTPNALIRSALLENGVALPRFRLTPAAAGSPAYPGILGGVPSGAGARSVAFMARDYVRPFIMMVDVAYERELARNISASVTYLFTRGNHLTHAQDINLNPPTTTVEILFDADGNPATTTDRRPLGTVPFYAGQRPLLDTLSSIPGTRLDAVIRETSNLNSIYHGVILQVNQRTRWGLTQTAHLTIASAKDEGQAMGASPFAGSFDNFFDPRDRRREYTRSDFDTRKRFVWHFIWEPSRVWTADSTAVKHILGNWSFSGVVTVHDGQPFTPSISGNISTDRVSGTNPQSAFSINGSGASNRSGWLPRNFLETTGFFTIDFRTQKDLRINERMRIRFLWEAFNLLNRSNHANRFNFSTTAFRVIGSSTPGGPPSNTALPRQVVLSNDAAFVGIFDPFTGNGDLARCTSTGSTGACLRSASGVLFGARDMQFGIKFIW